MKFLKDYFLYRKSLAPAFSFDSWAKELGFASRSYIRMITLGKKRATASFIKTFTEMAFSENAERDYFFDLASYSQAKTQRERALFGKKMVRNLQLMDLGRQQTQMSEHFDFLADTIYTRMLVLLGFNDLVKTPESLAGIIGRTPAETLQLLHQMESWGLARKFFDGDGDGDTWRATERMLKVPDQFGNLAITNFHKNILTEALEAFNLPIEHRRYRSLVLPLNIKEKDEVLQKIQNFANELLNDYQSDSYEGRTLYSLNLNIFAALMNQTRLAEDIQSS